MVRYFFLLFYELMVSPLRLHHILPQRPNQRTTQWAFFSPAWKNQKAELKLFTWLGFELIYAVLSKRKQCFLQYLCLSKVETPILAEIIFDSCIVRINIKFSIFFSFILVFFNVGCFRFGDSDLGHFPYHLNLVGASSNALSDVHLEAGWWVGAAEGEGNHDAQSNQDNRDGVDDDSLLCHLRILVLATSAGIHE